MVASRHGRLRAAAAGLAMTVAGYALSACASNGTPGPATASVTSISLSTQSSATGAEVTLRGTVRQGVEASCLLLADDDGTVLANLLGNDTSELTSALTAGAKVEVTGSFLEGVMTTCQQGPPFQVTAVKAR